MFNQITDDEHTQMHFRALTFVEAVVAVGVGEIVEAFAQFDEPVHQPFGNFDMRVRLAGADDDEQVAAPRERYGRQALTLPVCASPR